MGKSDLSREIKNNLRILEEPDFFARLSIIRNTYSPKIQTQFDKTNFKEVLTHFYKLNAKKVKGNICFEEINKIFFLNLLSTYEFKIERLKQAKLILSNALVKYENKILDEACTESILILLINYSVYCVHTFDYISAINKLQKAKNTVQKSKNKEFGSKYDIFIESNLGTCYSNFNITKSINHFKNTLDLSIKYNDQYHIILSNFNLAVNYFSKNDNKISLEYIQKCQRGLDKLEIKRIHCRLILLEVKIKLVTQTKLEEVAYDLLKANKIRFELNHSNLNAIYFESKGHYYYTLKNLNKSLFNFSRAMRIYLSLDDKFGLMEIYKKISSTYFELNDSQNAYKYLALYQELYQNHFSIKTMDLIRNLEEQQAQTERMEAEQELKKRLTELEHNALLAQMNPHFIFNSLNTLQELVVQKNEAEALNYITNFSTLLRELLENSRQQKISLQQELQFLEKYVKLEEVRLKRSFHFKVILPDEIPTHLIFIPVMMVQPLIENAIRHGLSPVQNERKLKLQIILGIENDFLHLRVIDNGIGYQRSTLAGDQHHSVALNNIIERLELIKTTNGNAGKLTITSPNPATQNGTTVNLWIPLLLTKKPVS